MNAQIEKRMNNHNKYLSEYACKDSEAILFYDREENIRTVFFRDIDRIIYSLAFIRYQNKTQVFSYQSQDHVSKRMIHVQFVSKIARTIGRALGLNEDLIEAGALGHDLGHTPLGHVGEEILNEISLNHGLGYFNHNVESVRVLMCLENYGKGLNISVQVLDAIMCHNGEIIEGVSKPVKKSKEEFLTEYNDCYTNKDAIKKLRPMTLEGCVVRVSDFIAYLGRDIDDAIRLGLIKREDIPKDITNVLGSTNKELVNTCILDIIKNSDNHNYLKFSPDIYEALTNLKKFNYEYIYKNSESGKTKGELKVKFLKLYDSYLNDLEANNLKSPIISSYLKNMTCEYTKENSFERIALDYIAGMTDDYFLREYERVSKN